MDLASYGQFLLALVFVLALIGLLALGARRLGFGPRLVARGGQRRLAIVEVLPLDAKRRLVLVRRDDAEHLLLLGATQDAVVETGIPMPAAPAAPSRVAAPSPVSESR